MASDRLIRHSIPLHAANLAVLLINAFYHRLISGAISPAEYGVLQALNSGIGLVVLPFTAITSGLTHFMSRAIADQRPGWARRLFRHWLIRLSAAALLLCVLGWTVAGPISSFFHFHRPEPVRIAVLVVGMTVLGSISTAPHAAAQSFFWLSGVMLLQAAGRLLLGVLLVKWAFPTAGWALLGTALAVGVAMAVALASARRVLPAAASAPETQPDGRPPVLLYVAWSIPFLLAYTAMFSIDSMVIKRCFPGDAAGYYGQVANLARLAVFLPLPFCRVLFPKVASGGTVSATQRLTWIKAVAATLALMSAVVGLTVLFPGWIAAWIFPTLPLNALWTGVLHALLVAMFANGLLHVLLYFETAQHRFATLLPLPAALAVYLLGIRHFEHDVLAATWFFAACNAAAAVATLALSALRVLRSSPTTPAPVSS